MTIQLTTAAPVGDQRTVGPSTASRFRLSGWDEQSRSLRTGSDVGASVVALSRSCAANRRRPELLP